MGSGAEIRIAGAGPKFRAGAEAGLRIKTGLKIGIIAGAEAGLIGYYY